MFWYTLRIGVLYQESYRKYHIIYTNYDTYPVGDERVCKDVGEVGVGLELTRTALTVPTPSTACSIKHPPAEAAATAAVVKIVFTKLDLP